MLGRVPSWRLITASDVTAFLAHTQMNPVVTTQSQAILAPRGQSVHGVDVVKMGAIPTHSVFSSGCAFLCWSLSLEVLILGLGRSRRLERGSE
jgi:hypothetical protein